jgi:hypothetical protein
MMSHPGQIRKHVVRLSDCEMFAFDEFGLRSSVWTEFCLDR